MIPIITPSIMLEEEAIWDVQDPIERIKVSANALFEKLVEFIEPDQHLIFLCGRGLNGADTLCLAKHCYEAGFEISVHMLYEPSSYKNELLHFYKEIISCDVVKPFEIPQKGRYVLIDGIFGAGFKGNLPDEIKGVIEKINSSSFFKIAIDIPSGIEGETGFGSFAVEADLTLSIGLPKWGLFVHKGRSHSGHVIHVDIGLKQSIANKKSLGFLATQDALYTLVPKEKPYFHKYQRGQVLGIASHNSFNGASVLYTKAAYRTGAGLVRLFHEKSSGFFSNLCPEVTQHELSELDRFLDKKTSSLILGPGLVWTSGLQASIGKILDKKIPTVIDGGAIESIPLLKLHANCVITPHLDELKRLLKRDTDDFDELLKASSNELVQSGLTLVIKGHHTWILHQDKKPIIFAFAPLAMGTAGSGDVLAGMMGCYLAKGLSPLNTAILTVGLHSLSGKIATFEKSKKAIMASDIIEAIPEAINTL